MAMKKENMKENRKVKRAELTERDVEILNYVNRFGKCMPEDIAEYIGRSVIMTRKIVKKLREMELLKGTRVFYNKGQILTCTDKGAGFTGYGSEKEIKLSRIEHDLQVVKVFNAARKLVDHEAYYTDRDMRQYELFKMHRPDIIFKNNGQFVAFEVELHRKSMERMVAIRKFYEFDDRFERVVYVVKDEPLKTYLENHFQYYAKFKIALANKIEEVLC